MVRVLRVFWVISMAFAAALSLARDEALAKRTNVKRGPLNEGNSAGSDYPHRVPRGEMPWRCRVAVLNVTCTCSILNQNWTLVPSYCFQGISDPGNAKIHVFAGGVEEDDWTQAEEATLFRRDDLNVSMLRLDKPFVFDSSNVSSISLHYDLSDEDVIDRYANGSGFGRHNESNSTSLWGVKLLTCKEEKCFENHSALASDPRSSSYEYKGSTFGENERICALTPKLLEIGKSFCEDGYKEFLEYRERNGRAYLVGVFAGDFQKDCDYEFEFLRYNLIKGETLKWINETIATELEGQKEPPYFYFSCSNSDWVKAVLLGIIIFLIFSSLIYFILFIIGFYAILKRKS